MIFVSYAHEDADLAKRFTKALGQVGLSYWWDEFGIRAGADWNDEINRAARDCTAACVLISDAALESEPIWREEIPLLQKYKKLITFVLIDELMAADIYLYTSGLSIDDSRRLIVERQWARDPAEGQLPRDPSEFRRAMRGIHEELLGLIEDARKGDARRQGEDQFRPRPPAECLITDETGDVFGESASDNGGFRFSASDGRTWRGGSWSFSGRPAKVVVSAQGDLVVVQRPDSEPMANDGRGGHGISATFWRVSGQPEQFAIVLPTGSAHVLTCWISGNARNFQAILACEEGVVQWSVSPQRGSAACVRKWSTTPWSSAVHLELDGMVSQCWIDSDHRIRGTGPANLLDGLTSSPERSDGWLSVDLAVSGSQVMVGGIRDDTIHVGMGSVAPGGKVVWGLPKVVKPAIELRSLSIGRVAGLGLRLGGFLVSDGSRSYVASYESIG